jgi:GDP-D-mannose dehydratase
MHLMMQQMEASDFVIGTEITHSVQELVELAFETLDLAQVRGNRSGPQSPG